jgi:rhodanese-related sulfurtransferase
MGDYSGDKKSIDQTSVHEVSELTQTEKAIQFVDVRQPGEYSAAHAHRAINLPLNSLDKNLDKLDPSKPTFVICQTGYRSSLATSMFENAGFVGVYNVAGGTAAWIEAGLTTETEEPMSCSA